MDTVFDEETFRNQLLYFIKTQRVQTYILALFVGILFLITPISAATPIYFILACVIAYSYLQQQKDMDALLKENKNKVFEAEIVNQKMDAF